MDTSEQFIKMCDCPEIQKDKVAFRDKDNFVCIEIKKRAYYIWLPRQDDIQKMIGKSESCFCIFQTKDGWGGEIIQDREHVFYVVTDSPEQIWLAFYMYKKHSKIWSSKEEKWVKK